MLISCGGNPKGQGGLTEQDQPQHVISELDFNAMQELYDDSDEDHGWQPLCKWQYVDLDGDGVDEVWMRDMAEEYGAFFTLGDDYPTLIGVESDRFKAYTREIRDGKGYFCKSGSAGGPSYYTEIVTLQGSRVTGRYTELQVYEDVEAELNGVELENYSIEDGDQTSITLSVSKRKIPHPCPECGTLTSRVKDYKNKTYFFRNINGYDVKVFFHQRRYLCPICNKTFLEINPFINNTNYKLSGLKVFTVLARLKEGLSLKLTADYSGVSTTSVIKVLEKYYTPPRRKFPKIICIDEFLSFNSDSKARYSCLIINFESGDIIDVIRSRKTPFLNKFFANVPLEQRRNVEYLIMDMYRPYKDAAKYYLPNATVVIDPFHFVRYSVDAIDSIRIQVMNRYDETHEIYKMLKK